MSTATKIRLGVLIHHLTVFTCLYYLSMFDLLVGFVSASALHYVVQSLWLHKGISHKWMKFGGWKDWLAVCVVYLIGIGSTISYAMSHRVHHMYADTDKDPHSPLFIHPVKVWFTVWKPVKSSPTIIADLICSPAHRWMHNHYLTGFFVVYGLAALFSPYVLYVLSLSSVLAFHRGGFYNTVAHLINPTSKWLSWISIHSLHHEKPNRW